MHKKTLEMLLQAHKKDAEHLEELIKEYVQNKKNPLDNRWGLFIDCDFGENKTYLVNFDTFQEDYYEYYRRYETIDVEDLIGLQYSIYIDNSEDILENSSAEEVELCFDKYIASFKEEILQMFLRSFIYDW